MGAFFTPRPPVCYLVDSAFSFVIVLFLPVFVQVEVQGPPLFVALLVRADLGLVLPDCLVVDSVQFFKYFSLLE